MAAAPEQIPEESVSATAAPEQEPIVAEETIEEIPCELPRLGSQGDTQENTQASFIDEDGVSELIDDEAEEADMIDLLRHSSAVEKSLMVS